jgi:hypothetical protein
VGESLAADEYCLRSVGGQSGRATEQQQSKTCEDAERRAQFSHFYISVIKLAGA